MSAFFQLLLSSSPAWGTFAMLFAVIWLAFRTEKGFTVLRAEMREGFLKVDGRLAEHDRDIKEINKEIKRVKKKIKNVKKTIKTP